MCIRDRFEEALGSSERERSRGEKRTALIGAISQAKENLQVYAQYERLAESGRACGAEAERQAQLEEQAKAEAAALDDEQKRIQEALEGLSEAGEELVAAQGALERLLQNRKRIAGHLRELDAVSYTHLDVYKRQVITWSEKESRSVLMARSVRVPMISRMLP